MSGAEPSVQATGDRWTVSGPMTMDTAARLLEASRTLPLPAAGLVDLERVDRADSAGVSVLLAWRRRAIVDSKPIRFAGMPQNMLSLAELYGVEEMLRNL